jgi:hypothetical protein
VTDNNDRAKSAYIMKDTRSILLLLLFLAHFANAQSGDTFEEESRLTKTEMQTLKTLFQKMIDSPDFLRRDQIYDTVIPMLKKDREDIRNFFVYGKEIGPVEIQKWAEKDVQPEKMEEAVKLMNEFPALMARIKADNAAYDELFQKVNLAEWQEIEAPYTKRRLGGEVNKHK